MEQSIGMQGGGHQRTSQHAQLLQGRRCTCVQRPTSGENHWSIDCPGFLKQVSNGIDLLLFRGNRHVSALRRWLKVSFVLIHSSFQHIPGQNQYNRGTCSLLHRQSGVPPRRVSSCGLRRQNTQRVEYGRLRKEFKPACRWGRPDCDRLKVILGNVTGAYQNTNP